MGDPHEKNPNSVNITLKKMTMKICLGRRDKGGRGGLWGIRDWGLGDWEEVEILSPDIYYCSVFFWYDSNLFPASRSSNFRDVSTWL